MRKKLITSLKHEETGLVAALERWIMILNQNKQKFI